MGDQPPLRFGSPSPWKARHSAARSSRLHFKGRPPDVRRVDADPLHDGDDPLEAVLSDEVLSERWGGEVVYHHQSAGALAGACASVGGEGGREVGRG